MENMHQSKRRRLDSPDSAGITKTNLDGTLDPSYSSDARTEADCDFDIINRDSREVISGDDGIFLAGHEDVAAGNIVCYGMLENLPITSIETADVVDNPTYVLASLSQSGIVQRRSDGACVGKLDDKAAECLFKFGAESRVNIQLMLKTVASRSCPGRTARIVALAAAILYGPEDLGDDIGDFLDRCKYYLQDPFNCVHNVPYKNPHCLDGLFEAPRMTSELHGPELGYQKTFTPSNFLEALQTDDALPEWSQPSGLKTELCRHQKQALWFFLMRESTSASKHVWQAKPEEDGALTYTNNITGLHQDVPPPAWNGGILADEMGLGKTLQMISLIIADKALGQEPGAPHNSPTTAPHMATLVVVPLPLISVWEHQLTCHVHPSSLTWGRHHRKRRLINGVSSLCPDVVLTTYQTVQSEYKKNSGSEGSLFGHRWRRIILDEAHVIRNRTLTSSAISALKAVSRWAVTGTPIQNSFADIGGLLRFLHFQPYDNANIFDKEIVEYFRREDVTEGVRRLKSLCQPIMIRRPNSVIILPTRRDLIKVIHFSTKEKQKYDEIENAFQAVPEEMDMRPSETRSWITTIQLINKLRLFCNLGLCSRFSALPTSQQTVAITPETDNSVETVVASELALGVVNCKDCRKAIDIPNIVITTGNSPHVYYSECREVYCNSCVVLKDLLPITGCLCTKITPCKLRPLSLELIQQVRDRELPLDSGLPMAGVPSKVYALVQEILKCLPEKSVVFSFWTTSLSIIQQALTTVNIRCLRIDGSASTSNRDKLLQNFKEDEEIKVMLITISCGGIGLDLTTASRVHLLEPQWNPAVEEQALARVYRMGQRRPVVTIRYIMKDSIEESVVTAKGKKQLLNELLLYNA